MQQRQMEFYRGFEQESPAKSKVSDEEFDVEYSQDVKAHLEGGGRYEDGEDKTDEDDEHVSFFPAPWPDCSGLLVSRNSPWRTCSAV